MADNGVSEAGLIMTALPPAKAGPTLWQTKFNGKLNLHPGSEVFYFPNLTEIKSDPLTVFGHGKYMLIEFQFHQIN